MTAELPAPARWAALGMLATLVAAVVVGGPAAVAVCVAAAAVATRYVPQFWRHVARGALSGVVAGLVVLGPGLRIAMRLVALADPTAIPEFTVAGTAMIVLMVGGVFGGVLGVVAALIQLGARLPAPATAAAMTIVVMVLLMADAVLREELMSLGAGAAMNIPLFATVAFAYAMAAAVLRGRLEQRAQRRPVALGRAVRA